MEGGCECAKFLKRYALLLFVRARMTHKSDGHQDCVFNPIIIFIQGTGMAIRRVRGRREINGRVLTDEAAKYDS